MCGNETYKVDFLQQGLGGSNGTFVSVDATLPPVACANASTLEYNATLQALVPCLPQPTEFALPAYVATAKTLPPTVPLMPILAATVGIIGGVATGVTLSYLGFLSVLVVPAAYVLKLTRCPPRNPPTKNASGTKKQS